LNKLNIYIIYLQPFYILKKEIIFFSSFSLYVYATYNSRKAIIKAKRPVASANANPKIAYENNWPLKAGFLDTPIINAPNTTPIPTPAPINPVVASPVPIILAACIILLRYIMLKATS
jgi:hypothetical protein